MAYMQNVLGGVQIQPSANGLKTFIHLSQGENGRRLYIKILGIDEIPAGSVATISGTKPDGNVYSATGTIDDITIMFNEDVQMTAVAGSWDANIRIVNDGNMIASARIRFVIHKSAVAPDGIPSDSQLDGIVAECQAYAESARSSAYGSPLTASTAADMIDKTKVYVYTGEETGYSQGHWYYWNGTAWTDGGVYNSAAIQTDKTLTLSDHAADAKATGDAIDDLKEDLENEVTTINNDLARKANVDGAYESMTVGNAEQIVSTVFTEDSVPYTFRTAGGSADIGDRMYDEIVGGTLAWNQLAISQNYTASAYGMTLVGDASTGKITITGTVTSTGVAEWGRSYFNIPIAEGHKYLLFGATQNVEIRLQGQSVYSTYGNPLIGAADSDTMTDIAVHQTVTAGDVINETLTPQLIDLTAFFGASPIPDYIYSLEQATAGSGVAWLKKYFPKLFEDNEYSEPTLKSVEGLQSHDTVGFNQWDEETQRGYISASDGSITVQDNGNLISKNYMPVLPDTTYYFKCGSMNNTNVRTRFYDADKNYIGYVQKNDNAVTFNNPFTTPVNAYYMLFELQDGYGFVYNHDICINLSWDGERDGEYEEYVKHSYPLDSSLTLRGIPKLDANNSLYYDGDTYEADGTVTRRYGIVDLGDLQWIYSGTSGQEYFYAILTIAAKNYSSENCPIVSDRYTQMQYSNVNGHDGTIGISASGNYVKVCNLAYDNATDFKTAMSGAMITYELATPTTESADPYTNPQIVDDFGTEEYVSTSVIPIGHNSRYAPNLRAKLEMAPDSPSGDGDYIVRQTDGQNAYVPLVIPDELPAAPTTDGTYVLKCTVASGQTTLTWETE